MALTPWKRSLSASFRRELEKQTSAEVILLFAEITHASLSDPIRIVSDTKDFSYNGYTWIGFPCDITIPDDTDSWPRAKLEFQNVDPMQCYKLRDMVNPPRVSLTMLTLSSFNTTVVPRTPLSTPPIEWQALHLYLTDVEVDAMMVSGTLRGLDYSQENYPGIRATQNRCPGLYK